MITTETQTSHRASEPMLQDDVSSIDVVQDSIKSGLIGDDDEESYHVLLTEDAKAKEVKSKEEQKQIDELMLKHMNNYSNAMKSAFSEIMEGRVNNGE